MNFNVNFKFNVINSASVGEIKRNFDKLILVLVAGNLFSLLSIIVFTS